MGKHYSQLCLGAEKESTESMYTFLGTKLTVSVLIAPWTKGSLRCVYLLKACI